MEHRPASPLRQEVYPVDPWRLIERGFEPSRLPLSETLFALANGHLGIRGSLEEGEPTHERGTYVNGFYETWPINYPEEAYGLPAHGQSIVTLPDATGVVLQIDGEPMRLARGRVLLHERELDMRSGVLRRDVVWEAPGGTRVRMRFERLVSFVHRHLAAFRVEITVLAGHGRMTLVSNLAHSHAPARPQRGAESEDPRGARDLMEALVTEHEEAKDQRVLLGLRTRLSDLRLACGIAHRLEADCPVELANQGRRDGAIEYVLEARPNTVVRLEKFAVYHTSDEESSADLLGRVSADLDGAVSEGFAAARAAQGEYLDQFWQRADIQVEGDPEAQQAVRWNLFQLAQATLRTDGLGVPAKGLTGRGYDGHYFWDVELYVQPFLTYTHPEISRRLLAFRHAMLDAARKQAQVVGERGALFPWRTINGEEASGHYPTSTAQYHINADIAHALRQYLDLTGDRDALKDFGAEILVETARLWASLGFYSTSDGLFHIHGVTGPDEYTAVVDDNAYTNLMARANLTFAADALLELRRLDPGAFRDFAARLEIGDGEADEWRQAAEGMYMPYDEERGIHLQDMNFLNQEPWDFAGTPADHYPLLLHYHPLVLHRHQVLKQADVVLAMFLLGDRFSPEQRRANVLYYEPITTGDSSLSHAIQAVMAAEVGDEHLALAHFKHALFMDLSNWAGNAEDGVHIASAGGVWLGLVHGFAGLRDFGGQLTFDPHLPAEWTSLSFRLMLRGRVLEVDVRPRSMTFRLRQGEALEVGVRGRAVAILPGEPVEVPLER